MKIYSFSLQSGQKLKKLSTYFLFCFVLLYSQTITAQSLFDKAHDAYADSRFKESIQLYSQYIADGHGDDKEAYFNRGLGYYELDEYEMAMIDFNKVVKIDYAYYKGYYQIASCQMVQKKYTESFVNYSIAIGIKPDYQLAYSGRGLLRYYQKDYSGSVSDFDIAIQLDPKDWDSFGSRGLSYHNLKLYSKAIEDFNACLAMNPSYKNAYTNRGLSNYSLGNKTKACEDWKKAATLGSTIAADNLKDFCQ